MHISYISPLSGWYLAQAQPDLTAKNPTHTRLEQLTRLELALSAWKADVLTTNTIAAYKNPAYKALLHHHWRAGNNSKGDQQTVRNHKLIMVDTTRFERAHRYQRQKNLNLSCLRFHHVSIN